MAATPRGDIRSPVSDFQRTAHKPRSGFVWHGNRWYGGVGYSRSEIVAPGAFWRPWRDRPGQSMPSRLSDADWLKPRLGRDLLPGELEYAQAMGLV